MSDSVSASRPRKVVRSSAAIRARLPGVVAPRREQYPSQPIRIIVPNPAGGLPDTLSRIVGKRLQERIGQPVVIENRPGRECRHRHRGADRVRAGRLHLPHDRRRGALDQPADLSQAALQSEGHDAGRRSWRRRRSGSPPTQKVPVTNMKEFAAYAKSKGGQATYGTSGVGSFHHLSMEAVQSGLGVQADPGAVQGLGQLGDRAARRPHRFRVLVLRLALAPASRPSARR